MQLALDDSEMLISAAATPAALPTADLMKESKDSSLFPPSSAPPLLRHRYRNSRISNQCWARVSRTGGPEGTGCSRRPARCPNGPSGKKEHTTFVHRRGSTNPSQRPLLSTILIIIIIIVRSLQLFRRRINKSCALSCCFSASVKLL